MMPSIALTLLAAAALAAAATTNTNLQTTFPTATATTNLPAVRTIAAGEVFDGEMYEWDRSPSTCQQQTETGESDAVFVLEHNTTLSNVIIGPNNGEGVHCRGSCTLNNIWWTSVCEDAATFKQPHSNSTSLVSGGGARNATDKVFQHNGAGTVSVHNFLAHNIGKLYRSCGNCSPQYARYSEFVNIRVDKAKVVVGVNQNFGDRTMLRDSCVVNTKAGGLCWRYEGNGQGKEPKKVGSGPEGEVCVVEGVRTLAC